MSFNKLIQHNNLKKIRLDKQLTQLQVAEQLNLNAVDRISKWEAGIKVPSVINLFRLANIYQVSVETLYPGLATQDVKSVSRE